MNTTVRKTPVVFVAYPSNDEYLVTTLLAAVSRANAAPTGTRYESWEFNDIPGNPIVSPILQNIEASPFVIADVTYLNLNVVYEIGYAIGAKKRAFLIRHKRIPGDRDIAKQAGIFDTLGYHEYETAEELSNRLTSYINPAPLLTEVPLDLKAPMYIVEPPVKAEAATIMTSRVKKARFRYRSFNPAEDARLSAIDAVRQVASSAGVMVSFDFLNESHRVHNIRAIFVAGLANGMGKPTLILSPAGYEVPMDVRDDVKLYKHPDDIADAISSLVLEVTDYIQEVDATPLKKGSMLQTLRIGDPIAENEMTTLARYFLQTDQFNRALQGDANLVVGRKGSGKTALFIQVRDNIRSDKRNVVVDLKPEGYQLIKLKEDILSYLTEGSRQHLITAFWEYLILLEVAHKLLDKDKFTHKHNHEIYELYLELEATYKVSEFSSEGDFSERLLTLSQGIAADYTTRYGTKPGTRLAADDLTNILYRHDIRKLQERVSKYLARKEAVWILFDNLDKGWSTQGVDVIDSIVLRCLIDAGRKVERDMQRAGHTFHCIIFIRNDVYEHLMQNSADYGKEMRAVLDWTDPDLLREMLRLRLVDATDSKEWVSFEQIWPKVCVSHYRGEDTSSYIIDRSLMRPRNVLKIFNHSRGFAANLNKEKIGEDDIEKGLLAYSHDLVQELDRELTDVFPNAQDIVYHFTDARSEMSPDELAALLRSGGVDKSETEKMIEFLLYYGILGIQSTSGDHYIFHVNYDHKMLRIRAERAGKDLRYVVNPAFWPALGIGGTPNQPDLI